ncbi:MAG: radical SAM protein [Clostridia bacterium]|nr:radical SAM protein [Clostridia bacterium]
MHEVEAKGILSATNGMNMYRGCQHGCIYCDARSKCYQINHEFEDIEVKKNAPQLLEYALKGKRSKCMIGTGGMTDPYMPLEKELGLTRSLLEIIDRYEFGLAIQTKSNLILRDLDLLTHINQKSKCIVQMTLTTYDDELCKKIEPNVCTTKERFEVLKIMRDHGIQTVVWLSPFLPMINDTEENIRGLLDYCIEAKVYGIICFGIGVTLREGDREYFYQHLDMKFPGLKQKFHEKYGLAYEINSDHNDELMRIIRNTCKEHGIVSNPHRVFDYMHEYESHEAVEQLTLF